MRTSKKTLLYLASAVWIIGGVMLFRSGFELIIQARELRSSPWPWIFIAFGIALGILQTLTIFSRSCRKNIRRIDQLEDPRLWQFFRPGFFIALAVMISSGVMLDYFSQGHYFFILGVAALDFALAISLLGSSTIFWTEKP
ncbi:MAG: hypothetical protein E4H33_01550 [Anaerolineales bacterium]|nr:MAG: hypothetical protein E4H33_01550 [Anaerolineales bacterium]